MRVWLVVAAALAVAGCADGVAPVEDELEGLDLEATSTTGVIRGVVVDETIYPVAGAQVAIDGTESTATTNEEGAFGFSNLEPGPYFLRISMPGFLSVQQSVEVQAGVDKPPIVRVVLLRDASFLPPSYELRVYQGFYQCGTSAVVVCAAPNILLGDGTTDDSSTPTLYFPGGEQFLQTEMVWRSTQALSPEMYFEMEALDDGCDGDRTFLENAEGVSPIRTRVNQTILEEADIGGDDCGIYYSIFSGDTTGGTVPPWGVGFSIEQDFEWYITAFYGYEPPEEWWFVESGPYEPPA